MAEEYLTDEEQLEQVKRVVAENWIWVAGGVLLGAALIFGYRYYDGYQNQRALQAAARFGALTDALEHNDKAKTLQLADGLIQEFPASPYADQAQLVLARVYVDDGQLDKAVAPLTQVMEHSKDTELKHVARLRLARVLTAEGKPDAALSTLSGDAPGAFAATYHEVRGDAFYAKHDLKSAETEYKAALTGGMGAADTGLLELKLADLASAAPPPDTTNKATP